jgi:sulfide:quinone oxidoreductase
MRRERVVVAGGGVGGVEAALALRDLCGDAVEIDLVAPERTFVYRALSVAEPFGYERAQHVPLGRLQRSHGIRVRRDTLEEVHPGVREVVLGDGSVLGYDALVLALGARQEAWLQGSVCFTGPRAVGAVREVLERMATGEVASVCFAAPTVSWTLPLYELALLTASWCAERRLPEVRLEIVTPEPEPLALFGRAAADAVTGLLRDRGVGLRAGELASAGTVDADAVVTLPLLRRTPLPGAPADDAGFVPVDAHSAVTGLDAVYAVGDITDQPVKQGGLAAQQADAAAAAIAHRLGRPVDPEPFRPVLRGLLLTGVAAAFLRDDGDGASEAAFDALWWPPTKIAGRYLGPFLAHEAHAGGTPMLVDRMAPTDAERAARDRDEVRRMAADLARAEARWGDHHAALHWLDAVERLDGVLGPELGELRSRCRAAL